MKEQIHRTQRRPLAGWGLFALVGVLLSFGALNIAVRTTSHKLEDGVFWEARPEGVTAADVAARGGAMAAGIQPGDVLVAIDGAPIETVEEVQRALVGATRSDPLSYTVLRLGEQQMLNVEVAPVPGGNPTLYVIGAAIGIFTLLVGASVRLRRPDDPATLHFFWLCLAFFGTLTFSFSRLDRLDWYFYWADVVATLLLAPLFLHFTLEFPDRPGAWVRGAGRRLLALLYVPAGLLFAANVIAVGRLSRDTQLYSRILTLLDQIEPLYLSVFMIAGLVVLTRAMDRVRSATARRQLRWIIWGTAFGAGPFAIGYALPYALGLRVSLPMELSVVPLSLVPLAFASALIRYRLMDVEVIVKRSLVYTAVILAIFTIYATLLRLAGIVFLDAAERHNMIIAMLATIVVVLLFSPVKSAIQNALDRAFYRDQYDYRRALVGFARDLNSDLDLDRLTERLVARIRETFVIDRMALLLVDEGVRRLRGDSRRGIWRPHGVGTEPPIADRRQPCRRHGAVARRSAAPWRIPRRRARVLASARRPLFRSLRVEGRDDCRARARSARPGRAAEQRGHGPAVGSRQPRRDGARKRTAVSAAPAEGRRAAAPAGVQREHRRVSRQRPRRRRPGRPRRPMEQGARGHLRAVGESKREGTSSRKYSTARSSRRCARRSATHRTARRSIACRWPGARRRQESAFA